MPGRGTEYSGGARPPERVSSRPQPTVPAASPAEISTVAEVVKDALADGLADIMDRFASSSTTRMRKETRPLKGAIAGVIAALLAGGGWLVSQVSEWQDSQRNQWAVEAKQLEQDEAMAVHLGEPHVSPAQIEALERKLADIEKKLDEALAKPVAITVPTAKKGR